MKYNCRECNKTDNVIACILEVPDYLDDAPDYCPYGFDFDKWIINLEESNVI